MSDEPPSDTLETVRATLSKWYQVPAIALVFAFMVWVRQRSWDKFTVDGEVYLSGNDAWYHFRQIEYTIEHWPSVMPYDVWTGFAVGTNSGQFGTLFDQMIATVALILGLGDPSTELVLTITAFAPVVIGALVVVPTYYIGRRLGGRKTGILAAVVLSLLSGTFLQRSLVGSADHNIAEPLMMSIGVLALLVTIAVAEREKPVWEQLRELELAPLRTVLTSATLAGVAVALYMYVWPPGIILVGIFGVFVLVKMTSDYLDDVSPEHLGIGAAIAMTVTGLLMAARLDSFSFSATGFTLLQVLVPLGVAAGATYISVLARVFEQRDVDDSVFPAAILGSVGAAVVAVGVALPGLLSMVVSNLLRFVGFNATAEARTIGEAQPFPLYIAKNSGLSQMEVLFTEYGFAFFLAIAMVALLLLVPLFTSRDNRKIALGAATPAITGLVLLYPRILSVIGSVFGVNGSIVGIVLVGGLLTAVAVYGTYDGERLFLATWTIFVVAAAFTQVRFNYYLAVPVAILSAYLPFYLFRSVDYSITLDSFTEPDWNAYLTVGVVLLLLVVPLAYGVSLAPPEDTKETNPPWEVGQGSGPGAVTVWDDSLTWMAENTPEEGNWGGADNASALEYYGTYEQTEDYDYPKGAYGVMSWWDYGHWLTVLGDRIPVANPFQQHATEAANFLIAPNETAANSVLDDIDENDAKPRYVVVDWQMVDVNGKFPAPVTFYDRESVNRSDFQQTIYRVNREQGGVQPVGQITTQRYYESMMVRLYRFHGSATSPSPIVTDWDIERVQTDRGAIPVRAVPEDGRVVKRFRTLQAANAFVNNDTTAQLGGVGDYPIERVDALQHYRQVKVNEYQTGNNTRYPGVKIFERVPGATVEGTGPSNQTVVASVEMDVPSRNTTFTYRQYAETDAEGQFEMTLPYSSAGYENWGVDAGYTNVSIRATGPYQFSTGLTREDNLTYVRYTDSSHVLEGQVIGENESAVAIDLERTVVREPEGANNTTETNTTNTTETTDSETNTTNTTDDTTTTNTTEDSTNTTETTTTSARVEPAVARSLVR